MYFFLRKLKISKNEKNIEEMSQIVCKLYFDSKTIGISENEKKNNNIVLLLYTNVIFGIYIIFAICSTSSPGGNQVDGLPPALNTGSVVIAGQKGPRKFILFMISN